MKKTSEAIKYAIKDLRVTPNKLFSLIESAENYSGENYPLWMANQVIQVASAEGIPFTELLVKKLKFLVMLSGDELNFSPMFLEYIREVTGSEDLVTLDDYNIEGAEVASDFDWLSSIDTTSQDDVTSIFQKGTVLLADLTRFEGSYPTLRGEAPSWGISLTSSGGAFMFKNVLLKSLFELPTYHIVLVTSPEFFKNNASITKVFLDNFNFVDCAYVNNAELKENNFISGESVITVWANNLEDGEFYSDVVGTGFGGRSSKFRSYYVEPTITFDKYIQSNNDEVDVYGSIVFSQGGYSLSKDSSLGYPITPDNIKDIIAYVGFYEALCGKWGIGEGLPTLLSGLEEYESFVADCLPLFLYGEEANNFPWLNVTEGNPLLKELIEELVPHMSFEAKELYELCRGYQKAMLEKDLSLLGLTFWEMVQYLNNPKFAESYERLTSKLREYVYHSSQNLRC